LTSKKQLFPESPPKKQEDYRLEFSLPLILKLAGTFQNTIFAAVFVHIVILSLT